MLDTKPKILKETNMDAEIIETLETYKRVLIERNKLRFSLKCPVYASKQENVDYWYQQVCDLENSGKISVQEVKNFLKK